MTYKEINRLVNKIIIAVIVIGVLFAISDGAIPDKPSYESDPKLQMRIDNAERQFQPW